MRAPPIAVRMHKAASRERVWVQVRERRSRSKLDLDEKEDSAREISRRKERMAEAWSKGNEEEVAEWKKKDREKARTEEEIMGIRVAERADQSRDASKIRFAPE